MSENKGQFQPGNPGGVGGDHTPTDGGRARKMANAILRERYEEVKEHWARMILSDEKQAYKYLELAAYYDSGKPTETVEVRPVQPITLILEGEEPPDERGDPPAPAPA